MSQISRLSGSWNFGQQVSPIRVPQSTEVDIERLSAAGAVSTADALTIAHATGSGPHTFTLGDGPEDGFQKTVCFNPGTVIGSDVYRLAAQFSPNPGYTYVSFPTAGGSVTLIWDDTNQWWIIQSTFLGTPTV